MGLANYLGRAIETLALMLVETGRSKEAAFFAPATPVLCIPPRRRGPAAVTKCLTACTSEQCDPRTLQKLLSQGAAGSDQHAGEVAAAARSY
jgi:hypothetical protein